MKNILLLLTALFFVFTGNAQLRWAVKAGGNLSKITYKDYIYDPYEGSGKADSKSRFGFHLGAIMEYSFTPALSIQPELTFIQNGTNLDDYSTEQKRSIMYKLSNRKIVINQLQLPINIKYKIGTDNLKFFAQAGPYFGYALSGKYKYTRDANSTESINIYDKDEFNNNEYKRFDFGVGVGIGVELSKFLIGLNYQYGISDMAKDKGKARMGTFLFSIGHFF